MLSTVCHLIVSVEWSQASDRGGLDGEKGSGLRCGRLYWRAFGQKAQSADEYVTVAELVQTVIEVAGKEIQVRYVEGPVGVQARNFSKGRMRALGWEAKVSLRAYDPHVQPGMLPAQVGSLDEVITGADCVLILTDHQVFRELLPREIASQMRQKLLIDTRNSVPLDDWQQAGFRVILLGKSERNNEEVLELERTNLC